MTTAVEDPAGLGAFTDDDYAALGRAVCNLVMMTETLGWASPVGALDYLLPPEQAIAEGHVHHVAEPMSRDLVMWCSRRDGHEEAGQRLRAFTRQIHPWPPTFTS